MTRYFHDFCRGVVEFSDEPCPRAADCLRYNPMKAYVDRLCYSGYSFFIPVKPPLEECEVEDD